MLDEGVKAGKDERRIRLDVSHSANQPPTAK